jgi:hypothetical protein
MIEGVRTKKAMVATTTMATVTVTTAEIASHASLATLVVNSETNTGTNVAARTPPMTMSVMMFGVVLARL